MPLQVPDAVEDAPADLARVDVPASGREPQDAPQWLAPAPSPFLAKRSQQSSHMQGARHTFKPERAKLCAPQSPEAGALTPGLQNVTAFGSKVPTQVMSERSGHQVALLQDD